MIVAPLSVVGLYLTNTRTLEKDKGGTRTGHVPSLHKSVKTLSNNRGHTGAENRAWQNWLFQGKPKRHFCVNCFNGY